MQAALVADRDDADDDGWAARMAGRRMAVGVGAAGRRPPSSALGSVDSCSRAARATRRRCICGRPPRRSSPRRPAAGWSAPWRASPASAGSPRRSPPPSAAPSWRSRGWRACRRTCRSAARRRRRCRTARYRPRSRPGGFPCRRPGRCRPCRRSAARRPRAPWRSAAPSARRPWVTRTMPIMERIESLPDRRPMREPAVFDVAHRIVSGLLCLNRQGPRGLVICPFPSRRATGRSVMETRPLCPSRASSRWVTCSRQSMPRRPVRRLQPAIRRRQMVCQFFNQMDGAMPPPCTPNRDRSVFFAFLHKSRQDQVDQFRRSRKKFAEVRVGLDVGPDLRVQPGPGPQYGVVVRVPQKACIEYQICFPRQALADRRRTPATPPAAGSRSRAGAEMPLDQLAQAGDRQVRGIHHQVGVLAQRCGQRLLRRRCRRRRGPAAPADGGGGFRCSGAAGWLRRPRRRPVRAAAPGLPRRRCERVQHRRGVEAAGAGVDADRQLAVRCAPPCPRASSAAGYRPPRSRHPPARAGSRPCRRRTGR